jgi:hypothetical protein
MQIHIEKLLYRSLLISLLKYLLKRAIMPKEKRIIIVYNMYVNGRLANCKQKFVHVVTVINNAWQIFIYIFQIVNY